jgi:hypothetical protein
LTKEARAVYGWWWYVWAEYCSAGCRYKFKAFKAAWMEKERRFKVKDKIIGMEISFH